MWKQLIEYGKRLANLVQKSQQHEEDIKQLRQDIKELNAKVDRLADAVQHMAFELQRERDNATRDRQILQLSLENTLLRFERRLPPGTQQDDPQE